MAQSPCKRPEVEADSPVETMVRSPTRDDVGIMSGPRQKGTAGRLPIRSFDHGSSGM